MVLDKMYNGIEILDMLAYLNSIPLLQNPMIDVIISNMYYGPYQREFFLINSLCFEILYQEVRYFPGKDTEMTNKLTICSYRPKIKSSKKYKENKFDEDEDTKVPNEIENANKKIGHMFQFVIWKEALDVRYIFNAIVAFTLACIMQFYSALLIDQ
jgi:hypothetical protein